MKTIILNHAALQCSKTVREFAKTEKSGFGVESVFQAIVENTANGVDEELERIYEKDSSGLAFSVSTTLRGGYLVGLANTSTPAKYRTLPIDKLDDALKIVAYQLLSLQVAFYKDGTIKVLPYNGIGRVTEAPKDQECIGVFDFLSEVAVKGRYVKFNSTSKKWEFMTTSYSDDVRAALNNLQKTKNKVTRDLASLESYMQLYEADRVRGGFDSSCIKSLDEFWKAADEFVKAVSSSMSGDKIISSQLAYILANFALIKEERTHLTELTKEEGLLFGKDYSEDHISSLIGNVKFQFPKTWSLKSWVETVGSADSLLSAYAKYNFNELLAGDLLWDAALRSNITAVTNNHTTVVSKKATSTVIKLPTSRGITMSDVRRQLFAAFKPLDFSSNLNKEIAKTYKKLAKPAKLYNKLKNHLSGDAGIDKALIPFYLTTLTMGQVGVEFRKELFDKAAAIAVDWNLEVGSKGLIAKKYAKRFENILALAILENEEIAKYIKDLPGVEAGKDLSVIEIPGFGNAQAVINQFVSDFSCVVAYLCHVFGAYVVESGFTTTGSRNVDDLICGSDVSKAKFVYPREFFNKILYINQSLDQHNPGQDTILALKSVKDKLDRRLAPALQLWHPTVKRMGNYVEWPAEKYDVPFKVFKTPGGAANDERAIDQVLLTNGKDDPSKVNGLPVSRGNVLFVNPEHVPSFDHEVEIAAIKAALKQFTSQLVLTLTSEGVLSNTEVRTFYVPNVPVSNNLDVVHHDNTPVEQQPGWLHFSTLCNSEGYFQFEAINTLDSITDFAKIISVIVPADINWVPTALEIQQEWERRIKMFCCRSVPHVVAMGARFTGSTKHRLTYLDQKGDRDLVEAVNLVNELANKSLDSTSSMVSLLTDVKNAKSFTLNSVSKIFIPATLSENIDKLADIEAAEMPAYCMGTVDLIPISLDNKLQFSIHLKDFSALTPSFARAVERHFLSQPGEDYNFMDPLLGLVKVSQVKTTVKSVDEEGKPVTKETYSLHQCVITFNVAAFVSQTNPLAGAVDYAPTSVMTDFANAETEHSKHPFIAYIENSGEKVPVFGFIHKTGFTDVDNFVLKAWTKRGATKGAMIDVPVALKNAFFMAKDVNTGSYLPADAVYLPRCLATNDMLRSAIEVCSTEGLTASVIRRIVRIINVLVLSTRTSSAPLHNLVWARSFLDLVNSYWAGHTDYYIQQALTLGRNNAVSLGPDQNDLNPVNDYYSVMSSSLKTAIESLDGLADKTSKDKKAGLTSTYNKSIELMEQKVTEVDDKLFSLIKQNDLYLRNMLIGADSITTVKDSGKTVHTTIIDRILKEGRVDGLINVYQNFGLKQGATSIFNKSPAAVYEFSYVAGSAESAFRAWVNECLYNLDLLLTKDLTTTSFTTTIDASTSWFDLSKKTFEGLEDESAEDGEDEPGLADKLKATSDELAEEKAKVGKLTEEKESYEASLKGLQEQVNAARSDAESRLTQLYDKLPEAVRSQITKESWSQFIKGGDSHDESGTNTTNE